CAERAVGLGTTQEAVALEPRAIEVLDAAVAERVAVQPRALLQRGADVGAMGDQERAGRSSVAGDLLARDEVAHRLDGLDAEGNRAAGRRQSPAADALVERDLAQRDQREAAVASAG